MSRMLKTVPLAGYSDTLSVRPGETIGFKVSSTQPGSVKAWLTRSICADPNPASPGVVEENADHAFPPIEFPGREQPFFPGSYAQCNEAIHFNPRAGFSLSFALFPTLEKSTPQTVFSIGSFAVQLEGSQLHFTIEGKSLLSTDTLPTHQWISVDVRYDAREAALILTHHFHKSGIGTDASVRASLPADRLPESVNGLVTIAAEVQDGAACHHFNGKIEAPALRIETDEGSTNVEWDFSTDMAATIVQGKTPHSPDLTLINYPMRGATGATWDGSEMCWRHAPDQYGAIHFHETDIYDFGWETDFTFSIPDTLKSGVYVMHIQNGDNEDAMPFFVCPPFRKPTAKVCVLVSTFTYAIYGNHARPDYRPDWQNRIAAWNAYPNNPAEYPDYGLSTYNFHSDRSGICHASHLRPLFNIRPGYLTFSYGDSSGLRHFQADSHLIAWLENQGIDYDLVTDQFLHEEGVDAIDQYTCVVTGSHPEYHTLETLNALQAYRDQGGNFCYLGGNGFYWKIVCHPENSGILEVRRAEGGIRAWAAEPGEYYHAFDGSYGGLWRRNGRPPQQLAGVGFSAQGQFNGSYYRRTCFDPKYDWIFEGVSDERLGDFGFSGGGAAGFELDRVDHRLGSPDNAVVLAQSENHSDDFVLVPEELLTHITTWSGENPEDLIRADMTYFETESGGSVFSTGSITFCGSLPWNDYDNNISTILSNVIRRLLD